MILTTTAGLIDLGFALFHVLFWKLLGWPKSLVSSGQTNSAVTRTLNLVLIYVFIAYGAALIWLGAAASPVLLVAGAGFWTLRAALQPTLFGMRSVLSPQLLAAFAIAAIVHGLAAASALRASGLPLTS